MNKIQNNSINLKKNINRFKLIAQALSKNNINILTSKDEIGGYYENNIILPKKINISRKKYLNKQCYIYKVLFSITSNKLNFYAKKNKENSDYKIITSIIIVKKINRLLLKEYTCIKKIIKKLYPIISQTRPKIQNIKDRKSLIEIIIKKITYEKITSLINLTEKEKIWIFKIENASNITKKNITEYNDLLYNDLCILHKNYEEIDFHLLWGYLYEKDKQKINKPLKGNILNKIKKQIKKKYIQFKQKKYILKNNKNTKIDSIFDYKKTHDNYINIKKNFEDSESYDSKINTNSSTKTNGYSTILIRSNIQNELDLNKIAQSKDLTKKIIYKEWDYKKNTYKKNWCHLFIKKITLNKKEYIKLPSTQKKETNCLKRYFKQLVNKKIYQNRKIHGQDIDIDSIIDNYLEVKNNTFDKVYKHKKKLTKDLSILILIDASLSTEGYTKEHQTLEKIKNIANLIATSINNLIKNFIVSAFYSNTRYDCRYIIIKDLKERWTTQKYNINQLKPNGYTRIGPAIRHSISMLKNTHSEKKIILLLSDGNPTDYDEYEGIYGSNDIKKAIMEATKLKINFKSILVNNDKNKTFSQTFGQKNYYILSNKKPIYLQLIKLLNSLKWL